MSDDLVQHLREEAQDSMDPLDVMCREAADEIERLTKSNTILRDALEQIITGVWSYLQSFFDPYTCGRHSKIERKIRK